MTAPLGPLARRIAARRGEPVPLPVKRTPAPEQVRRPAWLRNLEAKDLTGRVLS